MMTTLPTPWNELLLRRVPQPVCQICKGAMAFQAAYRKPFSMPLEPQGVYMCPRCDRATQDDELVR